MKTTSRHRRHRNETGRAELTHVMRTAVLVGLDRGIRACRVISEQKTYKSRPETDRCGDPGPPTPSAFSSTSDEPLPCLGTNPVSQGINRSLPRYTLYILISRIGSPLPYRVGLGVHTFSTTKTLDTYKESEKEKRMHLARLEPTFSQFIWFQLSHFNSRHPGAEACEEHLAQIKTRNENCLGRFKNVFARRETHMLRSQAARVDI